MKPVNMSPMVTPISGDASRDARLQAVSKELETSFLSEMLKSAGVGKPLESFGGGAGEEAFASMYADQYARQLVERGGIGLAEHIFESLKERN